MSMASDSGGLSGGEVATLKTEIKEDAPPMFFVLYEVADGNPAEMAKIRSTCTREEIARSYALMVYHDCVEQEALED